VLTENMSTPGCGAASVASTGAARRNGARGVLDAVGGELGQSPPPLATSPDTTAFTAFKSLR
jgi:hypothetical protein